MKIKRDALDILFSKYVKLRDRYCQRCGRTSSLQTAHFYSRRHLNTRFDDDNACLLCFSCHNWGHENPREFTEWWRARIGEDKLNELRLKSQLVTKINRDAIKEELKQKIKDLGG